MSDDAALQRRLLRDIPKVFRRLGVKRMASVDLVEQLAPSERTMHGEIITRRRPGPGPDQEPLAGHPWWVGSWELVQKGTAKKRAREWPLP